MSDDEKDEPKSISISLQSAVELVLAFLASLMILLRFPDSKEEEDPENVK